MQWQFYTSNQEAWAATLEACSEAKKSIDFEQYFFQGFGEGEIGRQFLELFVRKAKEGVKVRVIVDFTASRVLPFMPWVQELKDAGGEIIIYTISKHKWLRIFRTLFRDHRKICVVDSKFGFTGGVIQKEEARDWRDSWVRLEGPIVDKMQEVFDFTFRSLKENNRFLVLDPFTAGEFVIAGSGPRKRERHILRLMLSRLYKAEKAIYITSPYLNPTRSVMRALARARKRGVEINILIPAKTDHLTVDVVNKHFVGEFLKTGANVYLYNSYIHSKTIVVDGKWSTIGSANFDKLSLKYNFELNVFSENLEFSQELLAHFQNDITNSKLLTLEEWRKRPLYRKILEALSVLINEIV